MITTPRTDERKTGMNSGHIDSTDNVVSDGGTTFASRDGGSAFISGTQEV